MKSEIVVILDRSGSMGTIKDDAIGGYNTFIDGQKKVKGEATVTLIQFDHEYEVAYENVPINEVVPLNSSTYVPRGMTALYDAIGRTINKVAARHTCPICDKDTKIIFAILTDGQENSSREFRQSAINEMITNKRGHDYHWEFIFLAANQDAFATGGALGIKSGDTFNFVADSEGTKIAYRNLANCTTSYRTDASTTDKQ
jgi:hypothetical protein